MEQLKAMKELLLSFPQWGEQTLEVDTCARIEGCGLFPLGLQVLSRRQDVQGNTRLRLRQSFLLRRVCYNTREAAAWLMTLQQWLLDRPVKPLEAVFGENLQLWAELGKQVSSKQPGTGIYEVKIHAQYEKE